MREGKHQYIDQHGIIRLIFLNALGHLKNPMLWTNFVDMEKESFIETQGQHLREHENTTKYSVAKEEVEKEEEEENEEEVEEKKEEDEEEAG